MCVCVLRDKGGGGWAARKNKETHKRSDHLIDTGQPWGGGGGGWGWRSPEQQVPVLRPHGSDGSRFERG